MYHPNIYREKVTRVHPTGANIAACSADSPPATSRAVSQAKHPLYRFVAAIYVYRSKALTQTYRYIYGSHR